MFTKKRTDRVERTDFEISDIMEKIQLYTIMVDMTSIMNMLLDKSHTDIDQDTLERAKHVLTIAKRWLSQQIEQNKDIQKILKMNENELCDYLDKLFCEDTPE